MQENKTKRWSVGLKFVQWQVNVSRHETTGHSPFKVTFGQDPQVGLGSSVLPKNALCEITTEEELETFLAESETGTDTSVMEAVSATAERDEETATGTEDETGTDTTVIEAVSMTAEREEETATGTENETRTEDETGTDTAVIEAVSATAELEEEFETHIESFHEVRVTADKGQSKSADRMIYCGRHLLRPLFVGQCATLRIPDVDRGPSDPKNLLVVNLNEHDRLYTVGCREGILRAKFTAADLSAIDQVLIKPDEVPDMSIIAKNCNSKGFRWSGIREMSVQNTVYVRKMQLQETENVMQLTLSPWHHMQEFIKRLSLTAKQFDSSACVISL
ncbi:KRAB-A domain-containing protein 2 [Elysia marginata]|uniref:KRAB-A domain-containing protein 2 n=1 Tax=Elysia marginata TaxID=1093978 RepID=A0AAV4J5B7_9GAST|nr:KRAB-A domain-containing protein 2 [Elysia marginata]